jgi:hypothetical protein
MLREALATVTDLHALGMSGKAHGHACMLECLLSCVHSGLDQ